MLKIYFLLKYTLTKYFLIMAIIVKTHVNVTDVMNTENSNTLVKYTSNMLIGKFITIAIPVSLIDSIHARFLFIHPICQTNQSVLELLVWTSSS